MDAIVIEETKPIDSNEWCAHCMITKSTDNLAYFNTHHTTDLKNHFHLRNDCVRATNQRQAQIISSSWATRVDNEHRNNWFFVYLRASSERHCWAAVKVERTFVYSRAIAMSCERRVNSARCVAVMEPTNSLKTWLSFIILAQCSSILVQVCAKQS